MKMKGLLVLTMGLFLSGCATANMQKQQVQELQERVATLQVGLGQSQQEVATLKEELAQSKRNQYVKKYSSAQMSAQNIQLALKNAGFYDGPIDGKIGPKTKDAVVQFQESNGLKADGVVGRSTTQELGRYLSE